MAPRSKDNKEQENKDAAERARVEKQRREGNAALEQEIINEAAKSDERRAAEEAEALQQTESKRQEEAERAAAEQQAAEVELARIQAEGEGHEVPLSPNVRLLKAGTVLHLNGIPVSLPRDAAIEFAGAADEQQFASVLALNPENLALNADRLRLVYSPMNGTPLPPSSQRLTLDDMTDQERALFEAPARPKK
jgi:hypothetical protein